MTTPPPRQPATQPPKSPKPQAPRGAAASGRAALRRIAKRWTGVAAVRSDRDALRAQRDVLRLTVRDGEARLESMVAELHRLRELGFGRAERDRPGLRYLFVLTYGRTGSTLLQGILDRIPGYLIRGENGGIVHQLYGYHTTAMRHRDRLARDVPLAPTHPWWGIDGYPEDLALLEMRQLVLDTVLRPAADTRTAGFKEIDWDVEDLHGYLDFMRALFPGARFVVNTREIASVAASKWWANRPEAATEIGRLDAKVRAAAAYLGDDAHHVHYDDYVADPTVLRGLFGWLGEPWQEQQVRAVMSQRHSY